jgi:hypothetical protein
MQAQDSTDATGVALVSGRPGKELTRARTRKADAALALKYAGADWPDIARTLGYPTARAAMVAVELALEARLDDYDRERLRQIVSGRLDTLLRSVWPKATSPTDPEHLLAVAKARDLVDRHIRLWGLDAPTEVVVSSPTQEQLDAWVARVVSTQTPEVEEYDIINAEVTEDDDAVSAL